MSSSKLALVIGLVLLATGTVVGRTVLVEDVLRAGTVSRTSPNGVTLVVSRDGNPGCTVMAQVTSAAPPEAGANSLVVFMTGAAGQAIPPAYQQAGVRCWTQPAIQLAGAKLEAGVNAGAGVKLWKGLPAVAAWAIWVVCLLAAVALLWFYYRRPSGTGATVNAAE